MRALFVNPPTFRHERYGRARAALNPLAEPLGLCYLAAAVRQWAGGEADVLDADALDMDFSGVVEYARAGRYDLIGLSLHTPTYRYTIETVRALREAIPDGWIVLGGAHATARPEETLRSHPEVDFVVFGEGERTIVEAIGAIERDASLEGVDGLVYRQGDEVVSNAPRRVIDELDDIPVPVREGLPMDRYKPLPSNIRVLPSFMIIAVRGCRHQCLFCARVMGHSFRMHSARRIVDEMELLVSRYGARAITFETDTITFDKSGVLELCDEIVRRGLHKRVIWSCDTRVDAVDNEMLLAMKSAGCWQLSFGVESGVQRLLDLVDKGTNLDMIKRTFRMTSEAGINTRAYFMLGLPTETREDSLQSIAFAKEFTPDWVHFTLTTPYPGSKMFHEVEATSDWDQYNTWASLLDGQQTLPYVPEGRTASELLALQQHALRTFYLRPRTIMRHLRGISSDNLREILIGGWTLATMPLRDALSGTRRWVNGRGD